MSKVIYLIILAVLWLKCWKVVPFGYISNNAYYFATMSFMLYGLFRYRFNTQMPFWSVKMKPYYFIMAGIILSMIPAYLYYGQTWTQSLATYRVQYLWLLIPLLYRMVPSEEEIIKATFIITLLMWGVFFLRLYDPNLIVMDEETMERLETSERTIYITGFSLSAIPLYYYLSRIKEEFNAKTIIPIIICYAYIFTMQNRSLLFPITIFICIMFVQRQTKYKPLVIIAALVVVSTFFLNTKDIWESLLTSSNAEVSNKDYNRNVALFYFLNSNEHTISNILGNGFISNNVSDIMKRNMQLGIYNSDVGFIGYWNQFGIIPILTFSWLLLYALIKRSIPYNLKLWSAQIIICSLTISYFGADQEILFFSFFVYLLYYHRELASYEEEYYFDCDEEPTYKVIQQDS